MNNEPRRHVVDIRRCATRCAIAAALALQMFAFAPHPVPADENETDGAPPGGAILFASLAPRGWNLFTSTADAREPRPLTDHRALDYNAAFSPDGARIAFVSERNGNMELYTASRDGSDAVRLTDNFALDDHPAWSPDGTRIAFCSTRTPASTPGQAWNAIYTMSADGADVRRVSPKSATDYSPCWSPQGDWIACASGSGEPGGTDLYIMRPDGSDRRRIAEDGGWPTFSADGRSLYFHSRREGTWGIWRVELDGSVPERVTPDDVEAFTPRASADGNWLAMAVTRGGHRQIERMNLTTGELTALTSEPADHWNPSISSDGREVVYHRKAAELTVTNIELWGSPPGFDVQMLHPAGAFPAVDPDGTRVAVTAGNFGQIDVMNIDGSNRSTIVDAEPRSVFSLSWSHGEDRIAFSHGTAFQGPESNVDIETVAPDGSNRQTLTDDSANDGFPSFSPDGRQMVFRSGRDGAKNLYIMNRDGTEVRHLTDGKWTDTMADWSPTGEWIAFASDRGDNFEIWLIRPDGTGLEKLVGGGGRHNHPHFSPDGQWIVFTSQRAGLSAEEISLPHQPQPYGDLFAIRRDGTGLIRLTHNGFEEGTPTWTAATGIEPSAEGRIDKSDAY